MLSNGLAAMSTFILFYFILKQLVWQ